MKSSWKSHFLPELLFFQEGPGVRKWQFRDSGVKLLNVGNINKQKLDLSTTSLFLSNEEAYGKYAHFLVDDGDLLIACSGIVVDNFHNKIAFAKSKDLPLCMNTSTMRFKALDKNRLNINFFKYFLQTNNFTGQLRKLITGSAQLNFGSSHIKKISIPLPPLPVQERIAAILDAADALRQKDQALLKKYDDLTQSLFLDMFGDPVTNPKGWKKSTLGECVNLITYGLTVRPEYIQSGYSVISAKEIKTGTIDFSEAKKISSHDFLKVSEKGKPKKGEILYTKTGAGIGQCALIEEDIEFAITQNIARIDFKKSINLIYILNYLRTPFIQNLSHRVSKGNAIKDLQLGDMKKFDLILPPTNLQEKFSNRIQAIEKQKEQVQANIKKSEDLFQSLLQKAFKGELVSEENLITN
ncbi:MAG: restriction endonuclease subunit S [Cyclobacteriaceae bacterium]